MDPSAKVRERIRRLRELTAARGCTEAEALAAAEKAAQLMRDHGLVDEDIVMDEQRSRSKRGGQSMRAHFWPVIATCTNTAVIIVDTADGFAVSFLGREPGPAIAVYLRDVSERALDRAIADFKAGQVYRRFRKLSSKRAAVADFSNVFVARMNRRLRETFAKSIDDGAKALSDAELTRRYPDTVESEAPARPYFHFGARSAGLRAAEAVTLAHGVGSEVAPKQIGCRP